MRTLSLELVQCKLKDSRIPFRVRDLSQRASGSLLLLEQTVLFHRLLGHSRYLPGPGTFIISHDIGNPIGAGLRRPR